MIQQRSALQPAIGTVIWRALDQPCSSVFVPWYLGATDVGVIDPEYHGLGTGEGFSAVHTAPSCDGSHLLRGTGRSRALGSCK